MSIKKLDDEGYCNTFGDEQWTLTKSSLTMACGKKCGSLYVIEAKLYKGVVNVVKEN